MLELKSGCSTIQVDRTRKCVSAEVVLVMYVRRKTALVQHHIQRASGVGCSQLNFMFAFAWTFTICNVREF